VHKAIGTLASFLDFGVITLIRLWGSIAHRNRA
jgi:hypothetical protein